MINFIEKYLVPFYKISVNKLLKFIALLLLIFPYLIENTLPNSTALSLARGEINHKPIRNLRSFSIGNPEVISAKHQKGEDILLIRAKSIGRSDITYSVENSLGKLIRRKLIILVQAKRAHLKKEIKNSFFKRLGLG